MKCRQLRLEFDTDYGINKRTGWSVICEGNVLVQFVPFFRALLLFVRCATMGHPYARDFDEWQKRCKQIDRRDFSTLMELGFQRSEIDKMTPSQIRILVSK